MGRKVRVPCYQASALEGFMQTGNRMLPLSEACKELSISLATGQNWVKRGKLVPSAKIGRSLFFSRAYVERFKADIQSGKDASLKAAVIKNMYPGTRCTIPIFRMAPGTG